MCLKPLPLSLAALPPQAPRDARAWGQPCARLRTQASSPVRPAVSQRLLTSPVALDCPTV